MDKKKFRNTRGGLIYLVIFIGVLVFNLISHTIAVYANLVEPNNIILYFLYIVCMFFYVLFGIMINGPILKFLEYITDIPMTTLDRVDTDNYFDGSYTILPAGWMALIIFQFLIIALCFYLVRKLSH